MPSISVAERERAIERIARQIVEQFHPEAVILFGSSARGDTGAESDADFLVVMEVAGTRRAAAAAIRRVLHPRDIPVDIVVITPEQFEHERDVIGTLVRPAVREGKVLYARAV